MVPFGVRPSVLPESPVVSAVGIGRLPLGSVSGMAGSLSVFFVVVALRVGATVDCACFLAGSVGRVSTPFLVLGVSCFVAVFFG